MGLRNLSQFNIIDKCLSAGQTIKVFDRRDYFERDKQNDSYFYYRYYGNTNVWCVSKSDQSRRQES